MEPSRADLYSGWEREMGVPWKGVESGGALSASFSVSCGKAYHPTLAPMFHSKGPFL